MRIYIDSNGNRIPITENGIYSGAFYDYPTEYNEYVNIATIPVALQPNPNTADIYWFSLYSYVLIKHNGTNYNNISYNKDEVNRAGVFAIKTTSQDVEGLRFIALAGYDDASLMEAVQNGQYSYANDIVSFMPMSEAEEHIIEEDWDTSPSDDPYENPQNMNAIGGEYADVDPFYLTDNISIADLETMLNNIANLDYGGLIQPVILSQTETLQNLTDLNEGLFLADFWTNLKNKFSGLSDPLAMILDSIELPFRPAGDGATLKLGGIQIKNGSDNPIPVFKLTRRYQNKKIGTITLKEVWGTEKDYNQCSVQIYLPYVGVRDIDTDLAVNNTLTLYAVFDLWNGDILYILHCSNSGSAYKYMSSEFVAYRWNGNCGKKVPLGRVDNTTPILSLLSTAKNTAVGFATGGVLGAVGVGGMTALNSNFNPTVQSSGNLAGSSGRMDIQYPYLIIKRGVPSYPNNWRSEIGAPRYQEFQVSHLTGYTEFYEIHADDVSDATDSEKAEIENLLKSGVFIN